ncbi:DUF4870 family protein [Halomonas cerina]|uniref:Putative membrane protein n=1 Tax=Halomonas cerina TaxID=447424 RepID=A0A839V445_9GAMM|nr:DUF4870 domain-containing protein [Halomonas cerina]MBB3189931.1 putative membrane protein [Halomonas cerina]
MNNPTPHDRVVADQGGTPDTTLPIVVYALHLAGIITGGLTSLIAVVMAYVYRGKGPAWLDEHYRYQIRTFWIALLYFAVSGLLTLVVIGFLTWLAAVVWLVIRCVKGLKALNERRAPDDVDTWLF